jgi:hypothetical protein
MPNIIDFYQPNVWQQAGTTGAERLGMVDPYKAGILHLVYWQIYTQAGRDYFHWWVPGKNNLTEAEVRAELQRKLGQEYNVTGPAQEAFIAAHITGWAWVDALNRQAPQAERDVLEAAFKQNMAAVTWALWEDGVGPLFPLGW